ncbi:hypothetical protein E3P92_00331 [Wallemia ichthyophaga]|nr:hypothetical protein E3P92_00331 [Wallemia ichthyophaga]TIB65364.1 hypothetical protein E3P77_02749 [Wallemia ichthyophaga]
MRNGVILLLIVAVLLTTASAFGAGNILGNLGNLTAISPSYASIEVEQGKKFRHGDIMDALADLYKKSGSGILSAVTRTKFTSLDVKRIYFYDFLRDYSQANDTAALSKINKQTILNIVMVMSFLAFGYPDDAKQYDERLRGPVQQIELEIDPRTGMKNYIANESVCDTSTALVRERLRLCIEYGRRYKNSKNSKDEFEAFRWLGTSCHTLADFSAHSNFAEIYLYKLGLTDVFPHVGENVRIRAPSGENVPPIVTGSFGGMDFMASVLGEAGDKLTSASVSDLHNEVNRSTTKSRGQPGSGGNSIIDTLRDLIFQLDGVSSKVPLTRSTTDSNSGGGQRSLNREFEDVSNLRSTSRSPDQMSPQEQYAVLWQILCFRDRVSKTIEVTIDKIPGLSALVEKISNSIAVFIYSTLEPFIDPLIKQAKSSIGKGSEELLATKNQLEVYTDPNCSDPTHTGLAKDHFDHLLNNPCGNLAQIAVSQTTKRIVEAWGNQENPDSIIDEILEVIHHPYFANEDSKIQTKMGEFMKKWVKAQGPKIDQIERALNKQSCMDSSNKVHTHVQTVNDPYGNSQEGVNEFTSGGLWGLINTNASPANAGGGDAEGRGGGGNQGGSGQGDGGGGKNSSLLSSIANLGIGAMKNDSGGGKKDNDSKQPAPPPPTHSRPSTSTPSLQHSHSHSHSPYPPAAYHGRHVTKPPTPPGRHTPYMPYAEPPPMPDPGYMPGPGAYSSPPPMGMPGMGMGMPGGGPGGHVPYGQPPKPGMYNPPPMPMQGPPMPSAMPPPMPPPMEMPSHGRYGVYPGYGGYQGHPEHSVHPYQPPPRPPQGYPGGYPGYPGGGWH